MISFLTLLFFLQVSPDSSQIDSSAFEVTNATSELSMEESYYKKLYEETSEFQKSILTTVYWSLGSILGVIFVIIGTNAYFNFKLNKEELENVEKRNEEYIKEIENNLKLQIIENSQKNLESIRNELLARFKEYKDESENNLKLIQNSYSNISANQKALIDLNKDSIDRTKAYFGKQFDRLLKKYDILSNLNEGLLWHLDGVKSNTFSRLLDALELQQIEKLPRYLTLNVIEEVLKEADIIWKNEKVRLLSALNFEKSNGFSDEAKLENIRTLIEEKDLIDPDSK